MITIPAFLNDKFTPASLPEVCAPRTKLLTRFDEAAEDRLVFVSAQGGSGKTVTTLLWLKKSGLMPVWIGLDAYDNSPSVFYKLLATGLYSLQPDNENMGRICVMILQHTILWQLGRYEEARGIMDILTAFVNTSAQYFLANLTAYRTKLKLMDGDQSAAREWLDCYYVTDTDHIEFFRSFQHFVTARAYAAVGDTKNALHYLLLLREFGKNLNRPLDRSEAGVILAVVYWSMNRKKEAEAELEEALEILQPYGFVRIVADEGKMVVPILKRVLAKVAEKGYTGPLTRTYINEVILAAHSFGNSHTGYVKEKNKREDRGVKLSKQQTRMLELLSQGYKNAEISELTGLSIPTIKTHTSLAYKKLGVNNAMDAVLKAQELGLL